MPIPTASCPAKRPLEAEADAPCIGCARRSRCFTSFAYRKMFEAGGGQKLFLLSSCGDFQPQIGAVAQPKDIRPSLRQVGAEHLCDSCPSQLRSGCALSQDLAELESMAMRGDQSKPVAFTVFACRDRANPFATFSGAVTEEKKP
ncbi:hypothetical protein HY633_02865 [Candidatus Uhrbacteria bacterium]|nr:hypothetical protein [Candidatus Uhrbacteria bacterium]